jgi:hypothetical protein
MATPSVPTARETTAAGRGPSLAAAVWLVAATAAAAAGLEDPVRASWKAIPLREWATRVTPLADRPVIVDRRLDPDTAITLECRGEPLRDAIAKAAEQAGAESAVLRGTIRIVPRGQRDLCERADAARDRDLARLLAASRSALTKKSAWSWPEAARPRDLVAAVAAEAGVKIDGVDELPHDHFPAASLPEMTRAERIDLVLAHFDRRVAWRTGAGGTRGEIVPLAAELPPPRRDVGQRKKPPPRTGKPVAGAKDVFTLRAAAPLEELLAAVAVQQKLTLDLDRASLTARGIAAAEIVRIEVEDVSRDELLGRILTPLGLVWRIEADRLHVSAPPPPAARPE